VKIRIVKTAQLKPFFAAFTVFLCLTQTGMADESTRQNPDSSGTTAKAPLDSPHSTQGGSILDDPQYDPTIPWYQSVKSQWGIQLRMAQNRFPIQEGNGNLYQLGIEWMVPFQKIGIFSIGVNGGFLKLVAPTTSLSNNLFNPIVGGQVRYQLKFFSNQPIVPTGAVTYDYYQLKNSSPVATNASGSQLGLSYGLMLNLSWIDQVTARGAYQSLGLTKFYLTGEIFQSEFTNAVFYLNSKFYLFGIRAEFE